MYKKRKVFVTASLNQRRVFGSFMSSVHRNQRNLFHYLLRVRSQSEKVKFDESGKRGGKREIGKINAVKNSVRFYFLGQERAINIDTTSQTRTTNTVALNESPQNSRSIKQQSYRDNAIPYRIFKFQLRNYATYAIRH